MPKKKAFIYMNKRFLLIGFVTEKLLDLKKWEGVFTFYLFSFLVKGW
jgi:hypothetical protein